MGLLVKTVGDWWQTRRYLKALEKDDWAAVLNAMGKKGVQALSEATPERTGKTAASWTYRVERDSRGVRIIWSNTNLTSQGDPIAIILQYGHGTGTGGYVQGIDYINPAIEPVFDEIDKAVWEAVRQL